MYGNGLQHAECKLLAGTMILFFLGKVASIALIETTKRANLWEYLPIFCGSRLLCCLGRPEKIGKLKTLMTLL